METSFDDWLQPFEDSMVNHDNWLITDQEEGEAARKNGGMSAAFLLTAFGGTDAKLEDKFDEDEEIATGNQGDLERFFKHGSTGLDTLLANVTVKEELHGGNGFSFRWDDDEEFKLNGGSDSEDRTPSLLLDSEDQLLLNSGLLSFDDITLHSTSTSLSSPSLLQPSPAPSPTQAESKGSNPSSPAPSSSPLPSSPSSLLPAPVPMFQQQQQQQHHHQQQQHTVSYSQYGSMPPYAGYPAGTDRMENAVSAPPPPRAALPSAAVQSASSTPSSAPRATRARRGSTIGKASAPKKTAVSSTPPRPRRRRAASTTVARDKQDRMERELADDDTAKALLSGPLTLEKLSSLSTLKVSVLQKQLKMVNASTKGSKAQLIQRLVRYVYLFSQQHRHHAQAIGAGNRCSGPFVDPTLINADSVRAKAAVERGRSSSIGDSPSMLSTSAPSLSIASCLSAHVFPTPLQITLTGRIVEEEEEEEFSD